MMAGTAPLDATFFARPAERVARHVLGAVVVSTIGGAETAGRIVETEAYVGPHDAASHGAEHIGRTVRNRSMFGPPGIAYVYRSYGVHWCLNIVTDAIDYPAAVLIRAIEPTRGLDIMRHRRFGAAPYKTPLPSERGLGGGHEARGPETPPPSEGRLGGGHESLAAPPFIAMPPDTRLCSGPGMLASALGITAEQDGHPLDRPPLIITRGAAVPDDTIGCGPRIGITRAADWSLRFFVRGNPHVSKRASAKRPGERGTTRAPS